MGAHITWAIIDATDYRTKLNEAIEAAEAEEQSRGWLHSFMPMDDGDDAKFKVTGDMLDELHDGRTPPYAVILPRPSRGFGRYVQQNDMTDSDWTVRVDSFLTHYSGHLVRILHTKEYGSC